MLQEFASSFRAFLRPFIGEIAALRTDSIRQTTTSKAWKSYATCSGPEPFNAEHSAPYKNWQLAQMERAHKDAWPKVLAMLYTARRGLKWWYVCWRHAILLLNIEATRRDGEITSRHMVLFKNAYNESTLRVMLSPCQYYVDKSQRDKPNARTRNGLWCGISPDNHNLAWIWNGDQFISCEHGDVRVNEWIAWSIAPVGSGPLGKKSGAEPEDLFDDEGNFALFSDQTERISRDLVQVSQASLNESTVVTTVGRATTLQSIVQKSNHPTRPTHCYSSRRLHARNQLVLRRHALAVRCHQRLKLRLMWTNRMVNC